MVAEIGKKDKTVDLAAEVSKAALAGSDFLCEQAMNLLCQPMVQRRETSP